MLEILHADTFLFWLSEQGVLKHFLPGGSVEIRTWDVPTKKPSTGAYSFPHGHRMAMTSEVAWAINVSR
jgi:hypothetical protein